MSSFAEGQKRWRVLVADDEQEVTFALRAYFLAKGHEMLTALDGLRAKKLLQQYPIDLVLLDMKMPGLNGVEVLKFIHSESPQTRVIVVTAYDVQFQEMVEGIGVDGFLIKPFGIEALTSTLEEVLAGKKQTPTVPSTKEKTSVDSWIVPKGRLLFVEPSEFTYQIKEVYFSDVGRCGGVYQVAAAYSAEETLDQLTQFQPDILLVDLTMLGLAGDLVVKAMASAARPKELIIHGTGSVLPSGQNAAVEDLGKQGLKVVYNESFTQAGLARLGGVIRKTAIAKGLVETKENQRWPT